MQRAIVAAIEGTPLIEQVIHLRTLHVGPDSLLVAAKVAVRRGELAETITATHRRGRAQDQGRRADRGPDLPGA